MALKKILEYHMNNGSDIDIAGHGTYSEAAGFSLI
jgi:hypothetical protein